ncbi:MAG: hypothetical protein ABIP33_07410 [Pseudolysinimonas sp.]
MSNVVGRLGAISERLWGVKVGRVPSSDRYCTLVDELFYLDFEIDESVGTVRVRVIAWDRDLTGDLRGPDRVPFAELEELLQRVHELTVRAVPAPYVAALRDARQGRLRLVSAPGSAVSAEAALERRALRELGNDPVAHVDIERIEQLARQQWPRGEVTRTRETVEIRPYDTNTVSLQLDQHGSVEAPVILHGAFVLGTLLGRRLHTDNDERSVILTLAAIDDWMRLSEPSPEILAKKRLPR